MTGTPAQSGHLAMLAFSALVAGSFSLGALAAPLISPAALTVARFGLAGALVGAAGVVMVLAPELVSTEGRTLMPVPMG